MNESCCRNCGPTVTETMRLPIRCAVFKGRQDSNQESYVSVLAAKVFSKPCYFGWCTCTGSSRPAYEDDNFVTKFMLVHVDPPHTNLETGKVRSEVAPRWLMTFTPHTRSALLPICTGLGHDNELCRADRYGQDYENKSTGALGHTINCIFSCWLLEFLNNSVYRANIQLYFHT
jgi:hypothetical protein